MWSKFCETMLIVGTVGCVTFAWPTISEWQGSGHAQMMHSVALTAAGVGLVFAYHLIRSLRKEIAVLRDRGAAAN